MADLESRSQRWVRKGLITEQQRSAILAADGDAPTRPADQQKPIVRRQGPAAETFTFFSGLLLAGVAAGVTLPAAGFFPMALLIPAYILFAAGMAVLFGFRNAELWADVGFMASICLFGVAWTGVEHSEWPLTATLAIPPLIAMAIMRLMRLVVAVSAAGVASIYAMGSLPDTNYVHLVIGFVAVVIVGSTVLLLVRRRLQAWMARRANRAGRRSLRSGG